MRSQDKMASLVTVSNQTNAFGLCGFLPWMGFGCTINLDFLNGKKAVWDNSFSGRWMAYQGFHTLNDLWDKGAGK